MTSPEKTVAHPVGISHVRLTVTDIYQSKAFYSALFGAEPAMDFSDQVADADVRSDPDRLFGGCAFSVGDQIVGLRPAAGDGDRFDSTRVGLDHLSLQLPSAADLEGARDRLEALGIAHGDIKDLGDMGMLILSVQDPDDINLELAAAKA